MEAVVSCGRQSFRENILFTHRGLSGPAILQISSYWHEGGALSIDLAPGLEVENFLRERRRSRPRAELKTVLAEVLPARLAQAMAGAVAVDGTIANLSDRSLAAIAAQLSRWKVAPVASEGWSKAEVTVGGVDTAALSSRTMEAREVRGLYVIGEAVDVTGWLGGYNFQWAWSSGWCAGEAILAAANKISTRSGKRYDFTTRTLAASSNRPMPQAEVQVRFAGTLASSSFNPSDIVG